MIENGTLVNSGTIDVSGTATRSNSETVTNTGTLEVLANGALTIDLSSTIDNTSGQMTVDSSGTLTAAPRP